MKKQFTSVFFLGEGEGGSKIPARMAGMAEMLSRILGTGGY